MNMTTITLSKADILNKLERFVTQRPGLEFCNYGDIRAYRSELRSITQGLHDFRLLFTQVSLRDGITAEDLVKCFDRRLTIDANGNLEYCTGQYFPTEYRPAANRVLATALWNYYRDENSTGDSLRATFQRMFPRRIAKRYFD